jgi:hypothetical protein
VTPGPRLDVLEVEAEDVVALDHVGIALGDDAAGLGEQRRLVEAIAADDVAEARRVRERDGHDAIGRPRGLGNSCPSPVTTSMSSASRRSSPKRMPPNEVRPLVSRYCCTGSG